MAVAKGRMVRLPFEARCELNDSLFNRYTFIPLETPCLNWGVLRIFRLFFEDHPDLVRTEITDFKIGGSPNLLFHEIPYCAMDFSDPDISGLRAYPILISPNNAYVDVKPYGKGRDFPRPILLGEVMRDDAMGTMSGPLFGGPVITPGAYAR